MVVGLLGNKSPDLNRFTLVTPKSENDVRLQATLANQNPTGLPVGTVSIRLTHKVVYKLTMNHAKVQEKVGDIMGGKVLDLPEIRLFHEAKNLGLAEGEEERKKLADENEKLADEKEKLANKNEKLSNEIELLRKELERLKNSNNS